MSTRTGNVVVRNVAVQQLLVEVFVYLEKEIISSAVDNQSQGVWRKQVKLVNHCIFSQRSGCSE